MTEKALHKKITPPGKSFWQGELWTSILTKTGQAEVITMNHDGVQIVIERRTIWKQYTALYTLGIDTAILSDTCIQKIKDSIVTPSDLFLQIEPVNSWQENTQQETGNTEEYTIHKNTSCFSGNTAPFRRFIEPVTAVLNLAHQDENTLLASFAEKGRYNIRLAQKRGITTKWVKANQTFNVKRLMLNVEMSYIEAFYHLLDETTKRDGFAHNSLAYYQHFVETLEENNAGGLLVAEKDGVLHAAGIFVYCEGADPHGSPLNPPEGDSSLQSPLWGI